MEGEGRRGTNVLTAITIIVLLCVIGFLIWWFGFRSTNTNNNNQAQANTAAKSEIKSNWIAFFSGQTPADEKIRLLQNGQQFSQIIQAESQTPTAKATAATVSDVSLNGGTATVTYSVDINKQPALQNQKGQAVLNNGVWQVSDAAFCGLLRLSGNVPPNCPGASAPSGSSSAQTQTPTNSNSSHNQ